jgi:hypothetical protein
LVTAAERPELTDDMLRLGASPWPEFLNHGPVVRRLWRSIYELAPDYQFGLLDDQTNALAAVGNCIPIRWDGEGRTLPDRDPRDGRGRQPPWSLRPGRAGAANPEAPLPSDSNGALHPLAPRGRLSI